MVTSAVATADQTYGAVNILTQMGFTALLDRGTGAGRPVSNGWGSIPNGPAWNILGIAADFQAGSPAPLTVKGSVVNTIDLAYADTGWSEHEIRFDSNFSVVTPGTAPITTWAVAGMVDTNNYYFARLDVQTSGNTNIAIGKRVGGVLTVVNSINNIGTGHAAGQWWTLAARISQGVLYVKGWLTFGPGEPGWMLSMPLDPAVVGGTQVGVLTRLESGNTNTLPVTFTVDQVRIWPATTTTSLVRVTPDGVQTPVRNSAINTPDSVGVWWDDEAPLNTPVYYIASSPVSTGTATAISNSVTITGSGGDIGWLKDPRQPSLDVPLNFYLYQSVECTGSGVAITDFDTRTHTDNDGSFEIISDAYPTIVEMTRQSAQSTLVFTTLRQADEIAMRKIFATGRVLLLMVPTSYGWGLESYGAEWIHVLDVKIGRPNLNSYQHQQRIFSVDYRHVRRPVDTNTGLVGSNGIGVGEATWNFMKSTGKTWAQLKATGVTWAQLAQGQGY